MQVYIIVLSRQTAVRMFNNSNQLSPLSNLTVIAKHIPLLSLKKWLSFTRQIKKHIDNQFFHGPVLQQKCAKIKILTQKKNHLSKHRHIRPYEQCAEYLEKQCIEAELDTPQNFSLVQTWLTLSKHISWSFIKFWFNFLLVEKNYIIYFKAQ